MGDIECCPVCGGNGLVPEGYYSTTTGTWGSTGTASETCRSCGGRGVLESQLLGATSDIETAVRLLDDAVTTIIDTDLRREWEAERARLRAAYKGGRHGERDQVANEQLREAVDLLHELSKKWNDNMRVSGNAAQVAALGDAIGRARKFVDAERATSEPPEA